MKGKYKCDRKLDIYYPVNYKENLYQAKRLYVPGSTPRKATRKPLASSTPSKMNMNSVLKKYMSDYQRMMANQKTLRVKTEVGIEGNEYQIAKSQMLKAHLKQFHEMDFVDIDECLREFEQIETKSEATIKKITIEKDYDRRLGLIKDSSDEKKEDKVNQSVNKSVSSKVSYHRNENVQLKSKEKLEKELSHTQSKNSHKAKSSKNSSISKEGNDDQSGDLKADEVLNASSTHEKKPSSHSSSSHKLTVSEETKEKQTLPVPVIHENDLFETDQNHKMFTDIENRVLTSTWTDIINQNLQMDIKPQTDFYEKEDTIKHIQRSYRKHIDFKKRKDRKLMHSCWDDDSEETLMMIYYDKIADSSESYSKKGDSQQVLSLFVQIHSRTKMETHEEIISAFDLMRLGIFTEGNLSKKEVYEERAFIAQALFKEYKLKASSEMDKKRSEYDMVLAKSQADYEEHPQVREKSYESSLKSSKEKHSVIDAKDEKSSKSEKKRSVYDKAIDQSQKRKRSSLYKKDVNSESNSGFNIENNDNNEFE